jgi:DNA-binding LacI/PurR family transcriptional regulator
MTGATGGPSKPPTLYDVARLAGVSHQTVSLVLRGNSVVTGATKERVTKAVSELNYRPNASARSLALGTSHRIGTLAYDMTQAGPSQTLRGAGDAAREAGFVLDVVNVNSYDPGALSEALTILDNQDVAGILAFAPTDELRAAVAARRFSVPLLLDTGPGDLEPDSGFALNAVSIEVILDHLQSLGHEGIAHIAGPSDWFAARVRERAYTTAMRTRGLPVLPVEHGNWSSRSGYEAAMRLDTSMTTAVVVANDQMALGVILALRDRGLRVPEDVSVVGFDDIPEAEFFNPPLTTVRGDFVAHGRRSFNSLLLRIQGHPDEQVTIEASAPQLLIRESSGPRLR